MYCNDVRYYDVVKYCNMVKSYAIVKYYNVVEYYVLLTKICSVKITRVTSTIMNVDLIQLDLDIHLTIFTEYKVHQDNKQY